MPRTDVIVVGQGLAGSALAWRLEEQGFDCLVVDRGGVNAEGAPNASRVAAGLITPVTGKRLTIAADWRELFENATGFYRQAEAWTGAEFLTRNPALRLLDSAEEAARYAARVFEPTFAAETRSAAIGELPDSLVAQHGAFWMPNAARLAVVDYLDATRSWLASRGRFQQADIDLKTDLVMHPYGVRVPTLDVSANAIVLCQGHTPPPAPWLPATRLAPAKGEVITVRSPGLGLDAVAHRGVWVAPQKGLRETAGEGPAPGNNETYLVGSTHAWEHLDATPTAAARDALCTSLRRIVRTSFEVVGQAAAVRPATSDRQPIVGLSETHPRLGWLNGLGSKGALLAPWHAGRLVRMLAPTLRNS